MIDMEELIQDLTMNYSVINPDRKWYQVWKRKWLDKEITINNANIKIGSPEELDGQLNYAITVDPKTVARQFAHKVVDEELGEDEK